MKQYHYAYFSNKVIENFSVICHLGVVILKFRFDLHTIYALH